jgi:hypothetical protein
LEIAQKDLGQGEWGCLVRHDRPKDPCLKKIGELKMKRRSQIKKTKKVRDGKHRKSRYARKREYCIKNGVWGFEVEDKPWK